MIFSWSNFVNKLLIHKDKNSIIKGSTLQNKSCHLGRFSSLWRHYKPVFALVGRNEWFAHFSQHSRKLKNRWENFPHLYGKPDRKKLSSFCKNFREGEIQPQPQVLRLSATTATNIYLPMNFPKIKVGHLESSVDLLHCNKCTCLHARLFMLRYLYKSPYA